MQSLTLMFIQTLKYFIVCNKCLPFHGNSLEERPLGGIETAVIRLADALGELGNDVFVCTDDPYPSNPPTALTTYLPLSQANRITEADVLISVRDWLPLSLVIPGTLRFFWTGDAYDQVHTFGIGDKRVWSRLNAVLITSPWQAKTFAATADFPLERCRILPYGIHLPYFMGEETRIRKRLVYSSTPFRGLAHVPRLFRRVQESHPDATINIFSGYKVYDNGSGNNIAPQQLREYEAILEECRKTPGVTISDSIRQEQLAREFMKSSVLFYPNTFAETFCITAAEAITAGCVPVTSRLGALPTTVGEDGILIDGTPGTQSYDDAFVAATNRLLADDASWQALSNQAIASGRIRFSYKNIAREFHNYCRETLQNYTR